jgi:hypothetical protein
MCTVLYEGAARDRRAGQTGKLNCTRYVVRQLLALSLLLLSSTRLSGYSVLTHEAIIDAAWDKSIVPALKARFPKANADDLLNARAYAYGGCIIQDMGYFPFGSKTFSDLLHYVRSGDFVLAEIADAQTLNELAFAFGSLAHYTADNEGHAAAVNPTVGAEYPKLENKFGPIVTYAENPKAHLRVEFSFDVLQVARGTYAPQAYHDMIGFEIAKDLVNRAFQETYGLKASGLFSDMDTSIATYRYGVGTLIPKLTRQAWDSNRETLTGKTPGLRRARFVYKLKRADFEKDWSHRYQRPGVATRVLGWLVSVLPKVGPLEVLAFKPPTKQTETWFENSFNTTVARYSNYLQQAGGGNLKLPNTNFDTGQPIRPAVYSLADRAYADLAIRLTASGDAVADPKLAAVILTYFRDPSLPYATKKDLETWKKLDHAIEKLKASNIAAAPDAAPASR